MKLGSVAYLLAVTLFVAACESGPDKRYLSATLGDNLELPPDLAEVEVESRFELPANFSGDNADERGKIPVLARVDSLRLEGSGDLYWLNVNEPVDNLYRLVKNFWAAEGYRLVIDEPVIGIMQTEWIYKEQGENSDDKPWYEKILFGDNLSASQDQFRTRIERDKNSQGSRIFLAHRGTEYVHVLKTGDSGLDEDQDDDKWRFRQPEPELEVEMLSRLMIYLGLQRSEVEQQVTNVKLLQPRASLHIDADEGSPYLDLKDSYQIAWNRVYHQLERMNFNIESAEIGGGLLDKGVIVINTDVTESQESGGFFSFLSSSSETDKKKVVLNLTEETHELTRVTIKTYGGEYDTSPEGAEFLDLLYQNIK